jgi:hypothetical protein
MSTALITALRESGGYLRDDGYEQTAQLVAAAADEIERLNRRLLALETPGEPSPPVRRPIDRLSQLIKPAAAAITSSAAAVPRHRK